MIRFLLAFLVFVAAPAMAQEFSPAETARIDGIVNEALTATGVPSASIAVVRGGRIVLARAYGRQSPDIAVATPDALYPIASISKQFTAAAILILRDQGRLSLDDNVSKYLPGITGGWLWIFDQIAGTDLVRKYAHAITRGVGGAAR